MYTDNYCERVAPGMLGEPANALSNLAFLLASALLIWLLARQRRRAPADVWLLPVLLGVVGLCSLAFHTFATTFTGLLDTLSILLFIMVSVVVVVHRMWLVRWRWAWLAAPAYLVLAFGLNAGIAAFASERETLGGYIPALVGLFGFGLAIRLTVGGNWLLWAAGVFAVSLTLRTLDEPLCDRLPIGTHFLWHCLNATVLFLVAYSVIRRAGTKSTSAPARG